MEEQNFIQKTWTCSTYGLAFSADFSPLLFFCLYFLFVCVCVCHSQCFCQLCLCHIVLFWKAIQQRNNSSNIHTDKKKNVIWLLEKLGSYERASFCVSNVLFIYLKGCTLYQFTLPHSLRHRLEAQKLRELITFLLLFIK